MVSVAHAYIYGQNCRTVVPFIVSCDNEARWVFFIVDNVCPLTYFSAQVSKQTLGLRSRPGILKKPRQEKLLVLQGIDPGLGLGLVDTSPWPMWPLRIPTFETSTYSVLLSVHLMGSIRQRTMKSARLNYTSLGMEDRHRRSHRSSRGSVVEVGGEGARWGNSFFRCLIFSLVLQVPLVLKISFFNLSVVYLRGSEVEATHNQRGE